MKLGLQIAILLAAFGWVSGTEASEACRRLSQPTVFADLYLRAPAFQSIIEGAIAKRLGEIDPDSTFGQLRQFVGKQPLRNRVVVDLPTGDESFYIKGDLLRDGDTLTITVYVTMHKSARALRPSENVNFEFLKFANSLLLGVEDRLLLQSEKLRYIEIRADTVLNDRLVQLLEGVGFKQPRPNRTFVLGFAPNRS